MLTEVKAYSAWQSAPTLLLDDAGRPETDFLQIRNIEGLDPVKASVSTTSRGNVDGVAYTGSNVPSRNIVLTLHPNPDWNTWTYEALRKLVYTYFMPKKPTRLVFYSDDMVPVEISGIVESMSINLFSKDPEFIVSIICPDPYFTALDPTVITGQSIRVGGDPTVVTYDGNVETGIRVKVTSVTAPDPTLIRIQIGTLLISDFSVFAVTSSTEYFEMSSVPMQKFVRNVNISTGVIDNILSDILDGAVWPVIEPGDNDFYLITDQGVQDWELSYYERFGGI